MYCRTFVNIESIQDIAFALRFMQDLKIYNWITHTEKYFFFYSRKYKYLFGTVAQKANQRAVRQLKVGFGKS